jgi:hypothetical protein
VHNVIQKNAKDRYNKHLQLTTGIKKIRKAAAAPLAATVLYPTFKSLVASKLFIKVNIPVLAAVSPKRLRGP